MRSLANFWISNWMCRSFSPVLCVHGNNSECKELNPVVLVILTCSSFDDDICSIPQAYFFMTYIMTTGWAGFPLEILQSSVLILNYMKRMMVDRSRPLLSDVWSLPYYRYVPNVLLFIFLGLTYSIITPLLLPFLLVYFVLGYIVFRNQVPFPNIPFSCHFSCVGI